MTVAACASPAASGGASSAPPAGSPTGSGPAVSGLPSQGATDATWQKIVADKTIRVGFTNEPPFSIAEPEKITGADPEVLRAALAGKGVDNLEGVLTAFDGLIPGLLAKRLDIIATGLVIRPARCQQIAFGEPTVGLLFGLATKAGNPLALHSYEDIAKHASAKVGVIAGSVDEGYAKQYGIPTDRVVSFPDAAALLDGLRAGRIDAITQLRIQLAKGIEQAADPSVALESDFKQPANADGSSGVAYLGVGIRKEDGELLKAYNDGLAQLKSSGQLAKILEPFGFKAADIAPTNVTIASLCPA
jgi:polar amino acid transport system substrate-binding protein